MKYRLSHDGIVLLVNHNISRIIPSTASNVKYLDSPIIALYQTLERFSDYAWDSVHR